MNGQYIIEGISGAMMYTIGGMRRRQTTGHTTSDQIRSDQISSVKTTATDMPQEPEWWFASGTMPSVARWLQTQSMHACTNEHAAQAAQLHNARQDVFIEQPLALPSSCAF